MFLAKFYSMKNSKLLSLALVVLFISCDISDSPPPPALISLDFESGWYGGFADYPAGEEEFYELQYEHTNLPEPLDESRGAFMLSGNNHSDDLFMFAKRKLTGLQPNRTYKVKFELEFATNVANGMFGVGGSPGEGVTVKVGATSIEPDVVIEEDGWYRMNIDKSNQTQSGTDMMAIGNFANGTDQNVYTLKTLSSKKAIQVSSNDLGELWVIVGTDSGFESTTTVYFTHLNLSIRQ
jgi:hypothetical protein